MQVLQIVRKGAFALQYGTVYRKHDNILVYTLFCCYRSEVVKNPPLRYSTFSAGIIQRAALELVHILYLCMYIHT